MPQIQPTPDVLRAAMESCGANAEKNVGEFSDQTKTFLHLILQNDRLKLELSGIATAIGCPEDFDPLDEQAWANAGDIAGNLMTRLLMLCDEFFWIGWQSRAAAEEAQRIHKRQSERFKAKRAG